MVFKFDIVLGQSELLTMVVTTYYGERPHTDIMKQRKITSLYSIKLSKRALIMKKKNDFLKR